MEQDDANAWGSDSKRNFKWGDTSDEDEDDDFGSSQNIGQNAALEAALSAAHVVLRPKQLIPAIILKIERNSYTCVKDRGEIFDTVRPKRGIMSDLKIGTTIQVKKRIVESFDDTTTSWIIRKVCLYGETATPNSQLPSVIAKVTRYDQKDGSGHASVPVVNAVVKIDLSTIATSERPEMKIGTTFSFPPNFRNGRIRPITCLAECNILHVEEDPNVLPCDMDTRFDFIGVEVLNFIKQRYGVQADLSLGDSLSPLEIKGGKDFMLRHAGNLNKNINALTWEEISTCAIKKHYFDQYGVNNSDEAKAKQGQNIPTLDLFLNSFGPLTAFFNPSRSHLQTFAKFLEKSLSNASQTGERCRLIVAVDLDAETTQGNMHNIQRHLFLNNLSRFSPKTITLLTNNIIHTCHCPKLMRMIPAMKKFGRITALFEFDSTFVGNTIPEPFVVTLPSKPGYTPPVGVSSAHCPTLAGLHVVETVQYFVTFHPNDARRSLLETFKVADVTSASDAGKFRWIISFPNKHEAFDWEETNRLGTNGLEPLLTSPVAELKKNPNCLTVYTTKPVRAAHLYQNLRAIWVDKLETGCYRFVSRGSPEEVGHALYSMNRAMKRRIVQNKRGGRRNTENKSVWKTEKKSEKKNAGKEVTVPRKRLNVYKCLRDDHGQKMNLISGIKHVWPTFVKYRSRKIAPKEPVAILTGQWFKVHGFPMTSSHKQIHHSIDIAFNATAQTRINKEKSVVWIWVTEKKEIERLTKTQIVDELQACLAVLPCERPPPTAKFLHRECQNGEQKSTGVKCGMNVLQPNMHCSNPDHVDPTAIDVVAKSFGLKDAIPLPRPHMTEVIGSKRNRARAGPLRPPRKQPDKAVVPLTTSNRFDSLSLSGPEVQKSQESVEDEEASANMEEFEEEGPEDDQEDEMEVSTEAGNTQVNWDAPPSAGWEAPPPDPEEKATNGQRKITDYMGDKDRELGAESPEPLTQPELPSRKKHKEETKGSPGGGDHF